MFRRQFLLTALASVLAAAASAQEQKADAELDLGPVKGTEELWYLLTALDALIFCMAVAVIKDQAVIVQARREIQPYTSQLSEPKAEDAFNAALKSSEGQARVEQNKTRHQRRRQGDRRVVDRRRLAAGPRQRRSRVRAILDLARSRARPRTSRGGAASMRSGKCGASGGDDCAPSRMGFALHYFRDAVERRSRR